MTIDLYDLLFLYFVIMKAWILANRLNWIPVHSLVITFVSHVRKKKSFVTIKTSVQ